MLSLTVRSGDYITIGPDIVVQVVQSGETMRLAIEAPRNLAIERSKIHEQNADTPDCIKRVRSKPRKPSNPAKVQTG